MNLIAVEAFPRQGGQRPVQLPERAGDLGADLLRLEPCGQGQKAQTGRAMDRRALRSGLVDHFLAQHLETAADSPDGNPAGGQL